MIARVEPLTAARALRGPFDYRLPGDMPGVGVGSVLLVPFGRRRVLGVVVGVAERSAVAPERLVEPVAALDRGVPPELVRLGLWVASDTGSTPARGLALVLPPGTGTGRAPAGPGRAALHAALTAAGAEALAGDGGARLGRVQRSVLEALRPGLSPVATLGQGAYAAVRGLERRGLVTTERRALALGAGAPARAGTPDQAAAGARREAAPPAAAHAALPPAADAAPPPAADALPPTAHPALPPTAHPALPPTAHAAVPFAVRPALTPAQAGAVAAVEARLDAASAADRRLLLHGVTGSGKTEVYVRGVEAALARGRSAIVLVPEIALTPQTVARVAARFGPLVAVIHSRLGGAERRRAWMRLRDGEARVCVGPRSAVFAPVRDLGLVVVDEEHDPSYKQDGDPRYDARRVAARRAAEAGAVLLVGSATPRPEAWRGLERLSLPERVDGRRLPPVELVGMAGIDGALHPRTRDALEEVRSRGEKAIVLAGRRGWANFLSCRGCGRAWGCPECDVTLVLHRAERRVRCHHCGHAEPVPARCPDCGSASVTRHGAGTERLEEELRELLDPLPVMRLDSDVVELGDAVGRVLRDFDAAPAAVLVGTGMVAKGHDFPEVTLGVVLDADATLRFPDFRAEERTFAQVAQLAGRSGRDPRGGRVVVQALDPGARALRHAARHDAEAFLAEELERRRALRYPPFGQLVRVVCSSERPGPERAAAELVARGVVLSGAAVLGPAPLFRLRGRERAQIVVKAPERGPAVAAVTAAVDRTAADPRARGVAFAVDVDPH